MARRFTQRPFRTVQRRGTFWGRSPADTAATSLAASSAVVDSTAVPVAEGQTVIRIRGMIHVRSDQLAATEDFAGAVGAIILTDQAVAAGGTAVPTPYTDQDSDLWFMHQYFVAGVQFQSSIGFDHNRWTRFDFDSKAMRKMHSGQTLAFVVENGFTGNGMAYILNYAVLFKVA